MRLHPEVTEEEAGTWLREQLLKDDPSAAALDLDTAIQPIAEAMAAISRIVLPDELEPMFP